MARNTKVSAGNRGKPITAFFPLANKSPRQPPSSLPTASASRLARADALQNGENSAKLNSANNQSPASTANGAKGTTSGSTSPRRSERVKPVTLQPPAVITSLKRAREPETQPKTSSRSNSVRVRNADRRKSKFDSCSEDDRDGAVIYIKSPNLQQRKKPRVSPPTESSRPLNSDMVPSSQSDEELQAPPADHKCNSMSTTNKSGTTNLSKLLTPHRDDTDANAMDVDDIYAPVSRDEAMRDVERNPTPSPSNSSIQVAQMLTPPSSDLSSPPPTPVMSVVAKKSTENIIAAIKARAYAKSVSSPESDQLDFQDALDSSDDDQLPILPLPDSRPRNTRRKGKQIDLAPSSRASTRYSLGNHSRFPSEPKTKVQAKPAKKGSDPFTALLKEKHQAAKRGKGSDAIEKAESTILQSRKDNHLDEMEDEEDGDEVSEWCTNISSGSIRDILNTRNDRKDNLDLDLDEGDRERILEEEGGKTVLKILEQDRAERHQTVNDDKVSGIQLWAPKTDEESTAMAVDENYHIPGGSSVIRLLNKSLKCGGTARTSLLLNMNLMSAAQPAERDAIVSCFLDISLLPKSSPSIDAAFNTLTMFWSSSMQPSTSSIRFKDVLICLKHLGVDSQILAGQNWGNEDAGVSDCSHHREVVIPRLITLIMACARSGRLRGGAIADIFVALVLIGMDAGTPPALQRDLTLAIDLSMRCFSPDDSRSRENEFACASRVLRLSLSYSPVNKLRVLSLLSNGSGPSRRIADFVAYCMITGKSPRSNMYMDLPPLIGILEQFQSSDPPGIFALHEGTDYIDLGFHVAILGVAVSNLRDYVSQERQKTKATSMLESPGKMGDKPKTDLQLLHSALETLHSKISDSRATHLERSRTKAAVKQLAMNIHYQREFWLRYSRENRSITLAQYFKKKS